MLVLSRKLGETIRIGDDVEVTVVQVNRGKVRLAIQAPKDVVILRSELNSVDEANRKADREVATH
jgi:carbon storage regulator